MRYLITQSEKGCGVVNQSYLKTFCYVVSGNVELKNNTKALLISGYKEITLDELQYECGIECYGEKVFVVAPLASVTTPTRLSQGRQR